MFCCLFLHNLGEKTEPPRAARSSGGTAGRLVFNPRLLPAECRSVPERDALTMTAHEELAVALRGYTA